MKRRIMIIVSLLCFASGVVYLLLFNDTFSDKLLFFLLITASGMLIVYSDPNNIKKMGWKNKSKRP